MKFLNAMGIHEYWQQTLRYDALLCASKCRVDGSMAFVIWHLHSLPKIFINFSKITLGSIWNHLSHLELYVQCKVIHWTLWWQEIQGKSGFMKPRKVII